VAPSSDRLGLPSVVSEKPLFGKGRSLNTIADLELGVQVTQLCLHGVLADEEMTAQFAPFRR
jgi:hypothetical protein